MIEKLAKILADSRRAVFFGGAGMFAEILKPAAGDIVSLNFEEG